MTGPITEALVQDHHRLGALLDRALQGDPAAYVTFRGGLLRHIGIEEKILLPALRAAKLEPAMAGQLRLDHAALAAMLVPSPTPAILGEVKALLALHDPLEEDADGLYALADASLGDVGELMARIARAPSPPLAPHFDGPRAFSAIDRLMARAREGRGHLQRASQAAHLLGQP